jgi:hypothetical protein
VIGRRRLLFPDIHSCTGTWLPKPSPNKKERVKINKVMHQLPFHVMTYTKNEWWRYGQRGANGPSNVPLGIVIDRHKLLFPSIYPSTFT